MKASQVKEDRAGNTIGNGSYHVKHDVMELGHGIVTMVEMSQTTESVYVHYTHIENGTRATVRFSNHENNAVKFGDQLDQFATGNEILFKLGLIKRTFVPNVRLMINSRQVKKIEMETYQVADLTIQEMYALGAGANLSAFTGKLAKDSNLLIIGEEVISFEETKLNCFGQNVLIGKYIYEKI